jgi:ribosome maturation factor RimP
VRAIGEDVVLKMHPGIDPRRVKGTLTEVRPDEDGNQTLIVVVREVDGNDLSEVETNEVSLDEVDKARTVFEWGPAPKPGGPKSKNTNTKKKSSVQTSAPTQKNQKKTEETP